MQNYATYPSMPGALASIMPGFPWRDNGHKALCPLSTPRISAGNMSVERRDRSRCGASTWFVYPSRSALRLAAARCSEAGGASSPIRFSTGSASG